VLIVVSLFPFDQRIFEISPVVLALYSFGRSNESLDDTLYKSPQFQGHARKMVHVLGQVLYNMSTGSSEAELKCLATSLQVLGGRHVAYGVSPLHFSILETAILRALARVLDGTDQWTNDTRRGWAAVLKFIGKAMMTGARAGEDLRITRDSGSFACSCQHHALNDKPKDRLVEEDYAHCGTIRLKVSSSRFSRSSDLGEKSTSSSRQKGPMYRRRGYCQKRYCLRQQLGLDESDRVWKDEVIFESCEQKSDDEGNKTDVFSDLSTWDGSTGGISSQISPVAITEPIRPLGRLSDNSDSGNHEADAPPKKPQRRRSGVWCE
jgi:Globin